MKYLQVNLGVTFSITYTINVLFQLLKTTYDLLLDPVTQFLSLISLAEIYTKRQHWASQDYPFVWTVHGKCFRCSLGFIWTWNCRLMICSVRSSLIRYLSLLDTVFIKLLINKEEDPKDQETNSSSHLKRKVDRIEYGHSGNWHTGSI